MHNSARFAAVLAAAAFAYAPAQTYAQTCEDLTIGAALSATGIYAANGMNTRHGYEFAVKKINDAGKQSWSAMVTALTETRGAFDRANQTAREAFK